jgi:hypothetical protein
MVERPDYRKTPSATPEGSGRVRDRRRKFVDALPLHVIEDAFPLDPRRSQAGDLPDDARDELAAVVRHESELLGFWLAWHRAGGFAALERAGWHRATIFRKVRAFRDHFDTHPDDYRPDWIRLNLTKVWDHDIQQRLNRTGHPDKPENPDQPDDPDRS